MWCPLLRWLTPWELLGAAGLMMTTFCWPRQIVYPHPRHAQASHPQPYSTRMSFAVAKNNTTRPEVVEEETKMPNNECHRRLLCNAASSVNKVIPCPLDRVFLFCWYAINTSFLPGRIIALDRVARKATPVYMHSTK